MIILIKPMYTIRSHKVCDKEIHCQSHLTHIVIKTLLLKGGVVISLAKIIFYRFSQVISYMCLYLHRF